ncbi:MAG: hypothetical protein KDB29_06710, partial [Planctomycetes bacterium]|nr:hypothetical protein [Planctomycetota bacterium]
MPAVRPSGGHGAHAAVPELNPEALDREDDTEIDSTRSAETEADTSEDDSFVSPTGDLQHAEEVFDIPTDTARGFDTDLADDTDEPDDTDRPGSERQDQTSAPTRRTHPESATELEPESSTE